MFQTVTRRAGDFWKALVGLNTKYFIARKLLNFFKFWTVQNLGFDTAEAYLKFLDYIASWVGTGVLFGAFSAKVQMSTYPKGGILHLANWVSFVVDTALPCFLMFLFACIYLLSRQSVRLELAIGPKLFPDGRVPTDWGGVKNRVIAFFSVIAFLILYVALILFADNIKIASLIMLIIACNDWRTRYLIETGIKRYFSDDYYAPHPGDKDYDVIEERRVVAKEFLFDKPHLCKESGRVAGCGIAFAVSIVGYVNGTDRLNVFAYVILIATLIANEFFSVRWRSGMYWNLKAIDDKKG
ncbi:MAG: hypothetical protein ACR2KT_14815 [Methylocella sp.]|nr:MAG: hypothetical protein DLM68_01725 [Hyphomicrobiales bacterium]